MTTHTEYFTNANRFNVHDMTFNIGSPQPQPQTPPQPIITNYGNFQQVTNAPNGAPTPATAMTQDGTGANFYGAYPSPAATPGEAHQPPEPSVHPESNPPKTREEPRLEQSPEPSNGENKLNRPPLPTPAPSSNLVQPKGSPNEQVEENLEEGVDQTPLSHPIPRAQSISPSGPPPRLRHKIFVADGAKTALENTMPAVSRLFSKAGLKDDEWIAQAGFNEGELCKPQGRYEEVIVFIILKPTFAIKSLDKKKLKDLFAKFPVSIRSPSGEVNELERGSGKAGILSTTAHQHETNVLVTVVEHLAPVSAVLPQSPDRAKIVLNSETELSGLVDPEARLVVEANIAHKTENGDNGHRAIEFSKLKFRVSGQENPFFLRFAQVSLVSGDADVAVDNPKQQSRHGENYKKTTGHQKATATTHGFAINASKNPGVIVQKGWMKGSTNAESLEESINYRSVALEHLNPGIKVRYQYTKLDALEAQFLAVEDDLPVFSITPLSTGRQTTDIQKIRLTSFWSFRVDKDDVHPKKLGLWQRITSRRPEESYPKTAPCYTNFVHCIELEISTEFLGLIEGWKPTCTPLDLSLDTPARSGE